MVVTDNEVAAYPSISNKYAALFADKDPGWGFGGLGYVTYKRTYARPIFDADGEFITRTEEWHETLQRVLNGAQSIGARLSDAELHRLYSYMFFLKGSVSGRSLWQLGTINNTKLGGDSLCSCWYVDINEPDDFRWTIERLMLGGGVGFSCDRPQKLGVVRNADVVHRDANDSSFIVPDSREGWGELVYRVMMAYLGGIDDDSTLSYATHLVRPKGTPIKGFGGTASGPEILIEGIEKITTVLDGAADRYLTSVEVLDIINIIGSIVVAGNVRRAAQIALGGLYDREYVMAKRWDLGNIPNERAMSNNSVFVTSEQMKNMPDMIWEGYHGNGEPYGFFNLEASQEFGRTGEHRPDYTIAGTNPCGETSLAHRESCNLAEIYLPRVTDQAELEDMTILLYKVCKAIAAMPYLDRRSDLITSRNMRLGIGVTGVAQAPTKLPWLSDTYEALRRFDTQWSTSNGWPESVRLTTVKPSGTLSVLAGCTPGVHPGFSQYFIKGLRVSKEHSIVQYCKDKGYTVYPLRKLDGSDDQRTVIVDFPCKFPEDTLLAEDTTAVRQMDLVRYMQRVWSDNAVSVTVYYKDEELPIIQAYLAEHWHEMKSVSFLLHDDHGFDQAPLREITADEYVAAVSNIEYGGTIAESTFDEDLETSCVGGGCPVR